jgi:hypothetical protein
MSTVVQILASPNKIDPVEELQKKFALLKLGGKVWVVELPPLGVPWGVHGAPRCMQAGTHRRS